MLSWQIQLVSCSYSSSSSCRDRRHILAEHGPRGQGAVPGGGAGEGYAWPQRRLLLLHHGHRHADWCQWQWTHIPAPWVTSTVWVRVMQTAGHTHSGNQWKVQSVADCEKMFDIIPKRYLFDHTSLVGLGGFAASAPFDRTRLVIQNGSQN